MLSIEFDTHADAYAAGWVRRAEKQVGRWFFVGHITGPGAYAFQVDVADPAGRDEDIGLALVLMGKDIVRRGEAQTLFIRAARNRCERRENRMGATSDAFALSDFDAYVRDIQAQHPFLAMEDEPLAAWTRHQIDLGMDYQ